MSIRMLSAITLLMGSLLSSTTYSTQSERLLWHPVRLDDHGKLLAWNPSPAPYHHIITAAWNAFKAIPVQPNGYRTYITFPTFYGPNDSGGHALYSGRGWTHNPAGLFAMLTDSALLYHAYSGDRVVLERIRDVLDHHIDHGSTSRKDSWARVPYASSDAGHARYQGADERPYCYAEGYTNCGRGDGIGNIEPDKVGELGLAYVQFYEATLDKRYLTAALYCADALAKHVRPGDETNSPWPFRVDAKTGKKIREAYTANALGPIRLFDELIRINQGNTHNYQKAREIAWNWMKTYPMRTNIWAQYFEDIKIYPHYYDNLNQYIPLETARYMLSNPVMDKVDHDQAGAIIEWVTRTFAADSFTMAGLPEKGIQYGAEVISEQFDDMDKMSSHTARYASLRALWCEKTGNSQSCERAYRSFNWATYASQESGLVKTSVDEGTGYWFSDGYGDYMRHFQRGMASVPEWAPSDQDHLLRSSSVVQAIEYKSGQIQYAVYDMEGTERLTLSFNPVSVDTPTGIIPRITDRDSTLVKNGFTSIQLNSGAWLVDIHHSQAAIIRISKAIPATPVVSPFVAWEQHTGQGQHQQ